MNILFVYSLNNAYPPLKPLPTMEYLQFGISYISSFLKSRGHNTKLVVLSRFSGRKNKIIIDTYLRSFRPEVICFTAVATEYDFISNIAKYIKKQYPDIFLLIGGTHVSLNPEHVLDGGFDALCVGEGENPALELVTQLEGGLKPSRIPNLWIKNGLETEKNPPRHFLENLDNLPFPDREMWKEWIANADSDQRCAILLGRGCPFQCAYCCNHVLRKLAPGNYVRLRSTGNIIDELRDIVLKFPEKNQIYFEIETIGINKQWAIELCSKLAAFNDMVRRSLSYSVNLRITPAADYNDLFHVFKKSNFKFINIGLESGSERVRREILRREYSNQDIINAVDRARKNGLQVNFFNLIGIPGETISDFKETVKINRLCQPDRQGNYIFFPYPGTDLYAVCKTRGLLKHPINSHKIIERVNAVLDLPGFSRKQIQKSYIWFDYYVYRGYKPLGRLLTTVLKNILESNYYLNKYIYQKILFHRSLHKLLLIYKKIFGLNAISQKAPI